MLKQINLFWAESSHTFGLGSVVYKTFVIGDLVGDIILFDLLSMCYVSHRATTTPDTARDKARRDEARPSRSRLDSRPLSDRGILQSKGEISISDVFRTINKHGEVCKLDGNTVKRGCQKSCRFYL